VEGYKIHKDRTRCTKPGCPLPVATHWFAVLEFPECVRRDVCDACFQDVQRQQERPPVFWRARRRADGKKELSLDLAALRMLFDRLGEEEGDRPAALRYFVTLLLLRKRALRMVNPRNEREEQADLVVIDPKIKGMEPVALFAPDLDLDDMGMVKDELLAALEADDAARDDADEASPGERRAEQPTD